MSVTAREDVQVKGLYVRLQWRAHGRVSPRLGPETDVKLFEGSWSAGSSADYAFEFIAPAGPATYHGTILSVDHFLMARVESGWKLAGHAETGIVLAPPPPGAPYDRGPAAQEPASLLKQQGEESAVASVLIGVLVGLPGLAIILLGIAIALGVVGVSASRQPIPPSIFCIGFGTLLLVVAAAGVFFMQKRKLARRKLGEPVVEIGDVHAHRGEPLRLSVTLRPAEDVELTGASMILKGREQALSMENNNRIRHEFHRSDASLGAPRRLQAGQPVRLAGALSVPAQAPLSFDTDRIHVVWTVELKLELKGWPSWQRDFPIVVWP